MKDLRPYWEKQLNVIAANIANGLEEHRELAHAADHISAEYHGRVLVELIQNGSDETTRGGLADGSLLVVRSTELLAVFNQGSPLTDTGLKALTSVALGNKDPSVTIGNKGLGFKAVFDVSKSPELFSAPEGGNLLSDGGFRLAFSDKPLENAAVLSAVHAVVANSRPDISFERLVAEAAAASPFRFPVPLTSDDLYRRLTQLGVSHTIAENYSTVVVLPLIDSPRVSESVSSAVEALFTDLQGTNLLFLPHIAQLEVRDQVYGRDLTLRKTCSTWRPDESRTSPEHVLVQHTRTGPRAGDSTAKWVRLSRSISQEKDCIGFAPFAETAKSLPGNAWKELTRVVIQVAIPLTRPGASEIAIGPTGRFCIGLPTEMLTGSPFWINANFAGDIARTHIDFVDKQFNALLLKESLGVAKTLVRDCRSHDELEVRRLATLALDFYSGLGPIGKTLGHDQELLTDRIILAKDGTTFRRSREIAIPKKTDKEMFELFCAGSDPAEYGFSLPESLLHEKARELLVRLGVDAGEKLGSEDRYLRRPDAGLSFLEHGVAYHQRSGVLFWRKLFNWLSGTFSTTALANQHILPTRAGSLASATQLVYQKPKWPDSLRLPTRAQDLKLLETFIEKEVNLFDDRAIEIGIKSHMDTVAQFIYDSSPPLVRPTTLKELIRKVFGPKLADLVSKNARNADIFLLLRSMADWISESPEQIADDVIYDALLVPTPGEQGEWKWRSASNVYFGENWVDEDTSALLRDAYPPPYFAQTVSWADFKAAAGLNDDSLTAWRHILSTLGVRDGPRVIRKRHQSPLFASSSYGGPLIVKDQVTCPIPGVDSIWRRYIQTIRNRGTRTASGQTYDIDSVVWIQGLEREGSRRAIFDLLIKQPDKYTASIQTRLQRDPRANDAEATPAPTLWAFAIDKLGWEVVPTSEGRKPLSQTWVLPDGYRPASSRKFRSLARAETPSEANGFILALGAASVEDASTERLLAGLQDLAVLLDGSASEEDGELIESFYKKLNARLEKEPLGPEKLRERPLPFFEGLSRKILAVVPNPSTKLFIVDDSRRAPYVPEIQLAPVLPLIRGYDRVAALLRETVGKDALKEVSSCLCSVPFDPTTPPQLLVEFFGAEAHGFPMRREFALLLTTLRNPVLTAGSSVFGDRMRILDSTNVVFGHLPKGENGFFDELAEARPTLMVSEGSRPFDVFSATWEIAGGTSSESKGIWRDYSEAVERGRREVFFASRGISPGDLREAEDDVNEFAPSVAEDVKPAAFGLAQRAGFVRTPEEFEHEWSKFGGDPHALSTWLGLNVQASMVEQLRPGTEHELVSLLAWFGVSAEEYQAARLALRMSVYDFASSEREFEKSLGLIASALMTSLAMSFETMPAEVMSWIEETKQQRPPGLRAKPLSAVETDQLAIAWFAAAAESQQNLWTAKAHEWIQSLASSNTGQTRAQLERAFSNRAAKAYRGQSAAERARQANDVVNAILSVAITLASHLGERVDRTDILESDQVRLLSSGEWANRYLVLSVLERAIVREAPRSGTRLREIGAFDNPESDSSLRARLPELQHASPSPPPTLPKDIELLPGMMIPPAEVQALLSSGDSGQFGVALRGMADSEPEISTLRALPPVIDGGGRTIPERPSRGGGRPGPFSPETDEQKRINGTVGEAYVYEYLRSRLPAFDSSSCISSNSARYAGSSLGDDSVGADFIFTDLDGEFSGLPGSPKIYLEVKSSADDGDGPFTMTANEMALARRLTRNEQEAYIVVRVGRVRERPALKTILVDPVKLATEGRIRILEKDVQVVVG
jgi:hypothetical protein